MNMTMRWAHLSITISLTAAGPNINHTHDAQNTVFTKI
jgi:hypothetical protein